MVLRNDFHSLAEWDAFAAAVAAEPKASATQRWVRYWDKDTRIQTARRATLPDQAGGQAAYDRRVADPVAYDPTGGKRIYLLRP